MLFLLAAALSIIAGFLIDIFSWDSNGLEGAIVIALGLMAAAFAYIARSKGNAPYRRNRILISLIYAEFIAFFVIGSFGIVIFPGEQAILRYAGISPSGLRVVQLLSGLTLAMIILGIAYSSSASIALSKYIPRIAPGKWGSSRGAVAALCLLLLSYAGIGILVLEHGGFGGLLDRFLLHRKIFAASTVEKFGMMLWTTFYAPAAWTSACAFVRANSRIARIRRALILGLALGLNSLISILLFGSRLQLLYALAGALIIIHVHYRRISFKELTVLLVAMFAISLWVVGYRTGASIAFSIPEIISNLGYGVMQVFTAIDARPPPIEFIADIARWANIPLWLVPRFIWPNKPIMTTTRLDWLIADFYRGFQGVSTTGYPSSAFSEWFMIGGWIGVFLGGLIIGTMAGACDSWYSRHPESPSATLLYIWAAISLFNYFKDGDIVMSAISTFKSLILVALIIAFMTIRIASIQRTRSAANYRL